ncbi:hypothetical protein ONZ45_g11646 [Pleurotus djamor]|nr:hypothetical protein ONZ45_g11646 [Pleurotus djamor]
MSSAEDTSFSSDETNSWDETNCWADVSSLWGTSCSWGDPSPSSLWPSSPAANPWVGYCDPEPLSDVPLPHEPPHIFDLGDAFLRQVSELVTTNEHGKPEMRRIVNFSSTCKRLRNQFRDLLAVLEHRHDQKLKIHDLPPEIMLLILSYLNSRDRMRLTKVSKKIRNMIIPHVYRTIYVDVDRSWQQWPIPTMNFIGFPKEQEEQVRRIYIDMSHTDYIFDVDYTSTLHLFKNIVLLDLMGVHKACLKQIPFDSWANLTDLRVNTCPFWCGKPCWGGRGSLPLLTSLQCTPCMLKILLACAPKVTHLCVTDGCHWILGCEWHNPSAYDFSQVDLDGIVHVGFYDITRSWPWVPQICSRLNGVQEMDFLARDSDPSAINYTFVPLSWILSSLQEARNPLSILILYYPAEVTRREVLRYPKKDTLQRLEVRTPEHYYVWTPQGINKSVAAMEDVPGPYTQAWLDTWTPEQGFHTWPPRMWIPVDCPRWRTKVKNLDYRREIGTILLPHDGSSPPCATWPH